MTTSRNSVASWVIASAMLLLHGTSAAFELPFWNSFKRFRSEIILPQSEPSKSRSSVNARNTRTKAQRYIAEETDATPPAPADGTLPPPDERGEAAMFPRAPSAASESRLRARDRMNGTQSGVVMQLAPVSAEPGSAEARHENVTRNIEKAQGYSGGGSARGGKAGTFISLGTAVGVPGPDGVLVVSCDATNNAAGRIGSDEAPGNAFDVVVNGKLVRARCK